MNIQAGQSIPKFAESSGSDQHSGRNSPLDFPIGTDDEGGFTDEEDDSIVGGEWLSENFKSMSMDEGVRNPYHGKASSLALIRTTVDQTNKSGGGSNMSLSSLTGTGPSHWEVHPVSSAQLSPCETMLIILFFTSG